MSEISDELRKRAKTDYIAKRYGEDKWLSHLADRIDAEMVELPNDADGRPYSTSRDDECVWDNDGNEYCVDRLEYTGGDAPWDVVATNAKTGYQDAYTPDWFTHERPDSFERIAQELDAWCDEVDVDRDACGVPRALAGRIRRLAGRDEER